MGSLCPRPRLGVSVKVKDMPVQAPKRLEPKWLWSWVSSYLPTLACPLACATFGPPAVLPLLLALGASAVRVGRGRGFGFGFPWLWGSPVPSVLPRCAVSRFVLFRGEQTGHGSWAGGAPFCALFLALGLVLGLCLLAFAFWRWLCSASCVCIWRLPFAFRIRPFAVCAFFASSWAAALAMVDRPCLVGSSHMAGARFSFSRLSRNGTWPCVCMPVTWR